MTRVPYGHCFDQAAFDGAVKVGPGPVIWPALITRKATTIVHGRGAAEGSKEQERPQREAPEIRHDISAA